MNRQVLRKQAVHGAKIAPRLVAPMLLLMLGACASLGGAGPSSKAISGAGKTAVGNANIKIIDVTGPVASQVRSASRPMSFIQSFGDGQPIASTINSGDILSVTIWEAPPAALFGGQQSFGTTSTGAVLSATAGPPERSVLPEMMVDTAGFIRVPFAGPVRAAGRTPQQIERDIVARLARKAHDPQVIVRAVTNANATVTVMGDVATNTRIALTPRGERLLDVIASAGGVKQPVGKMTVQITRGDQVIALPLEAVVRNPAENIRLQPDDVVTAFYQPFSFTSLGATGLSAEIPFEGTGLTLSQALGRMGGLKDDRANVRGVFIFRFEDPAAVDPAIAASAARTPDGKIPVIYRVDLSKPATMFIAQNFPIEDKDILYVSSAPMTDLQKFVSIVSSMAFTVIGLGQAVP